MQSYKEKSIWISLVSTILVFGFYFLRAVKALKFIENVDMSLVFLFIGSIALLVIIQIVLQTTLAILYHKEANKRDERDRLIAQKATSISYIILVVGIWLSAASLLLQPSVTLMLTIIMFFFFVAEIVNYSMQLFYYKRGM